MKKLFGTDGVRGVANVYPMTSEMAMQIGRAAAHIFKNGQKRHRIVIGKDTRLSGYMIENALSAGICSMGVDVLLVGPLPTPGIANITSSMRADAGVVISASHNPFQDNGIKFFSKDGFKLPDEVELKIEASIFSKKIDSLRPVATEVGKAYRIADAVGRYVVFLKSTFPKELDLTGMKIVLDCANGAAYKVAPAVLEELGAEVIPLGVKPNGTNINAGCGSLHPEVISEAVKEQRADLGIALDGDADPKPLGLVHRGLCQVHHVIETAGLALVLVRGIELHFVAVGQVVRLVRRLVIGVEEDSGIGVGFAAGAQLQDKVGEWNKLSHRFVADVKEV